ncbi:MAG TPA: flagellar hook-length control protein FliK, partial [Planctomycetota bacterium]|nr:flagellar hook-length control protein FliK [Planctomycetota bacterium]
AFGRWLAAQFLPGGERAALDLGQLLAAALAGLEDKHLRERLQGGLARLRAGRLGAGLEALALRRLLGLGAPPRGLREAESRRFAATAAGDQKGRLLDAAAAAGEGDTRAALERALAGFEAEQLLNVARRGAGEPLHWSLPLIDGERSATAHLLVDSHASGPGGAERTWRLGLALDLSGTGALRADLIARPGALLVALAVEREDTHAELAAHLDELRGNLARAGTHVSISLRRVPRQSLPPPEHLADVGFLREHHLMDLSA